MSKNKKTVKQQMKYWRVKGLIIKARTARVAIRKYLRNNLIRDVITREFELDNPFTPGGGDFNRAMRELSPRRRKYWKAFARKEYDKIYAVEVNKNER
jgi:hypothetical protein